MAFISGFAAELYSELVPAVGAATAFGVGVGKSERGKSLFTGLTNGDTIMYKAVSLDDPSKWEIGLGTYVSASSTLTRTTVVASSNANAAVNFKRADGSGNGSVQLDGASRIASTANAYTITNIASATRTLSGSSVTSGDAEKTLAALIQDLVLAGVLKGSIS